MKKIIVLFMVLLFIANCAPSIKEARKEDYGEYPTDYKEIIKIYFDNVLKDPESAKYDWFEEPFKGYYKGNSLDYFKPVMYGYICPVGINAKNSFGGYTGMERVIFIIKDKKILLANEPYKEAVRYWDESGFFRLEE